MARISLHGYILVLIYFFLVGSHSEYSPACSSQASAHQITTKGEVVQTWIDVDDLDNPILSGSRMFGIYIPEVYDPSKPSNVLFYLHGLGDDWTWCETSKYNDLSEKYNYLVVYPKGMDDDGYGTISWNYGSNADLASCDVNEPETDCYESCKKIGICTRCSWSSCYDDFAFLKQIIDLLKLSYCVDKFWLSGASNVV